MNQNEKTVIKMLRYYYWMKYKLNLISEEMMARALDLILKERNPFRDPDWLSQFQENAKNAGYGLGHGVFHIKLGNDQNGN